MQLMGDELVLAKIQHQHLPEINIIITIINIVVMTKSFVITINILTTKILSLHITDVATITLNIVLIAKNIITIVHKSDKGGDNSYKNKRKINVYNLSKIYLKFQVLVL